MAVGAPVEHRVVPAGCADILFTSEGGTARLEAVGPMTVYRDHVLARGTLVGVRFHPGMWRGHLRAGGAELTDRVVGLEELWNGRARALLDRMGEARDAGQRIALLAKELKNHTGTNACATLIRRCGAVSVEELARESGWSARQLRRLFLQETGLTPKLLGRVLRFRRALGAMEQRRRAFADLALECGYYDQAHLIHDFRRFAGRTPGDGRILQAAATAGSVR